MIRNYIDKEHRIVIDSALKYVSDKYGGEFEYVNFIGQSLNFPGDRIGVRHSDGECFTVFAYNENNSVVFRDSYYSVFIKERYEEFIRKIVGRYIKRFDLSVEIEKSGCNPCGLSHDVEIRDIHTKTDGDYIFYSKIDISVPDKLSSKKLGKKMVRIANRIAGYRLMCRISCRSSIGELLTYYIDSEYKPILAVNKLVVTASGIAVKSAKTVLSNQQLERLCIIVYLNNITSNIHLGCLRDIMLFMKYLGITDNIVGGELPCEMTRAEWETVIDDIINDPMLGSLEIPKYIDITETSSDSLSGHRAICFTDKTQNAYAVFRGTSGDAEWYDNALGMLEADTPFQKAAADFIKEIRDNAGPDIQYLVAAGHSKGGNKAQYSAVVLPSGYVDKCFTLDGQGFSKSFCEKYENEIKRSQNNIISVAERRDFVNCLGFYLCKPVFYSGRRGNHTHLNPYGEALPYFHCPDALRTADDNIGEIAEYAYIPKTINEMTTYFFGNPKYKDIWEQTAVSIISLMMRKRKAAISDVIQAAVNLITVFAELVSQKKEFYDDLLMVIETESDVLIATALMISKIEIKGKNDFSRRLADELVTLIRKNPVIVGNLLTSAVKFTSQIVKVTKDNTANKTIYILICNFLAEILKKTIDENNMSILQPVYKRWLKLCDALKDDNVTEAEVEILSAIADDIVMKFM